MRFIGGFTIQHALKRFPNSGLGMKIIPIWDRAGEGFTQIKDVHVYKNRLCADIDIIATQTHFKNQFLALKVSSFTADPNAGITQMCEIISRANANKIKVLLDAEDHVMKSTEQQYFQHLKTSGLHVFKTYQMYRKDSLHELDMDLSCSHIVGFKLVRGAYLEKDQNSGFLLSSKEEVDNNYDAGVNMVMEKMRITPSLQLMIATHNLQSVNKALRNMDISNEHRIYFAQLLGMGDSLTKKLLSLEHINVCKYIPYGLPCQMFPYLTRRLYENYDIMKHWSISRENF